MNPITKLCTFYHTLILMSTQFDFFYPFYFYFRCENCVGQTQHETFPNATKNEDNTHTHTHQCKEEDEKNTQNENKRFFGRDFLFLEIHNITERIIVEIIAE